MADSCGKTKYAMGATMLGVLLSGCVMTSREPRPQSPPDYPATVGKPPTIQDVSSYQRNYRFLPSPSGSTTEVAFWITRDDSGDFHVPWVHGGDWFVAGSERVVIDPVGKTLALDFGAFMPST